MSSMAPLVDCEQTISFLTKDIADGVNAENNWVLFNKNVFIAGETQRV